ncbi:hypothetical protein ACHQM5_023734 [Ranunculus cassubicifolius]
MSTTRTSVLPQELSCLQDVHVHLHCRSHKHHTSAILSVKRTPLLNHGVLSLDTNQINKHTKRAQNISVGVGNEIHQLAVNSPSEWQNWLYGLLLSFILPLMKNKFARPLLLLKNQLDTAMQSAEMVTERVEEVAEKMEDFAEKIAEKLPDDVELKNQMKRMESITQEAVKDAKAAEELIHKEEDTEKKLEEALKAGGIPTKVIAPRKVINPKDIFNWKK